jgi:hypothetical protein
MRGLVPVAPLSTIPTALATCIDVTEDIANPMPVRKKLHRACRIEAGLRHRV